MDPRPRLGQARPPRASAESAPHPQLRAGPVGERKPAATGSGPRGRGLVPSSGLRQEGRRRPSPAALWLPLATWRLRRPGARRAPQGAARGSGKASPQLRREDARRAGAGRGNPGALRFPTGPPACAHVSTQVAVGGDAPLQRVQGCPPALFFLSSFLFLSAPLWWELVLSRSRRFCGAVNHAALAF